MTELPKEIYIVGNALGSTPEQVEKSFDVVAAAFNEQMSAGCEALHRMMDRNR